MSRPLLCFVLAASLLNSACHKDSTSLASSHEKAFRSAPVEVKSLWEAATAAARTNNYADAYLALLELGRSPGLTPEQQAAIAQVSTAINNQMREAADKGDANAKKAIEQVKQSRRP